MNVKHRKREQVIVRRLHRIIDKEGERAGDYSKEDFVQLALQAGAKTREDAERLIADYR
jgi:hypothetical protein